MSEWALFIGLKVLEVGTVVFLLPWLVGRLLAQLVTELKDEPAWFIWLAGFAIMILMLLVGLLSYVMWTEGFPTWFNYNWSLVERILG